TKHLVSWSCISGGAWTRVSLSPPCRRVNPRLFESVSTWCRQEQWVPGRTPQKMTGISSTHMTCIDVHGESRVSCLLCPSQRVLARRSSHWLSRPMLSTARPTFSIDTGPFYADSAIWP
ncbi:uncharacterized protein BJ171DRAFT_490128, partial [Polychytrium aggregatum]|uniref:uncharacterized protein n=1 Tax=Polychytrium aggregatum TaxID=110093 RepID=UPI0022FE4C45